MFKKMTDAIQVPEGLLTAVYFKSGCKVALLFMLLMKLLCCVC